MLTLSLHWGALTTGWVVSLTDYRLTPQSGLPDVYEDREFGVLHGSEGFLPRVPG